MDTAVLSLTATNRVIATQKSQLFRVSCSPKIGKLNLRCSVSDSRVQSVRCAMKSYKLSELSPAEVDSLKARPRIDFTSIFGVVQPIVDDVQSRGDAAVVDYTSKFDKVVLEKVVEDVSDLPDPELDPAVKEAFDVAYNNIYAFHLAQRAPEKNIENMTMQKNSKRHCCCGSICTWGNCCLAVNCFDAFSACSDCWMQDDCSCNSSK